MIQENLLSMSWVTNYFSSSLGKKIIMAITGLFLCVFLLTHLVGNLFLFAGPDAFNQYAEFMATSGYIRGMEIVLFLGFAFHIIDSVILTKQNKDARGPVSYKVKKSGANSTWFSRNMGITGFLILLFLILHLYTFFYPHRITGTDETMYVTVVNAFQQMWYSAVYIIAFVILGFHLNHGFQSAFRSFGWVHTKYSPFIRGFGTFFAIAIAVGYTTIPVYFLFFYNA